MEEFSYGTTLWLWYFCVGVDDLSWGADNVNRHIMNQELVHWDIIHQLLVMNWEHIHKV